MRRDRILVGLAAAVLGLVLLAGQALAAEDSGRFEGSAVSGPGGGGGAVLPASEGLTTTSTSTTTTTSTTIADDVLGETETRPPASTGGVLPFTGGPPASTGGVLPFTGGDLVGLTVLGAAALGIGAVIVRRQRGRSPV